MKDTPVLFNPDMVRAYLANRKNQTRRIVKPVPPAVTTCLHHLDRNLWCCIGNNGPNVVCPYGQPGDYLWGRETFSLCEARINNNPAPLYRATSIVADSKTIKWKPSIFMPRWATRITMKITNVRAERVQDISAEDAIAEGAMVDDNGRRKLYGYSEPVDDTWRQSPIDAYRNLWNSIHLDPSPIYTTDKQCLRMEPHLKKKIIGYQAFPWSLADFEAKYPGVWQKSFATFRGNPITIIENPYVWAITFEKDDCPF